MDALSVTTSLAIVGLWVAATMGMVALVNPPLFRRTAKVLSRWIDTDKSLAVLDKRVDIDGHVFRHTRLFGAAVVIAGLTLAWLFLSHRV